MGIRDEILKDLVTMNVDLQSKIILDDLTFDKEKHINEVLEELEYHIGKNKYSDLFLNQLSCIHSKGFVNIEKTGASEIITAYYSMIDIYSTLKLIVNKPQMIEIKEFEHKNSFLFGKNIYHVHHNQVYYLQSNTVKFFKRKYKNDNDIITEIKRLEKQYPNRKIGEYVFMLCYQTLNEVIKFPNKVNDRPYQNTGEWIIFQQNENKFNFIALALHSYGDEHDKRLYELIKPYISIEYI
jgi:hypothetical protein